MSVTAKVKCFKKLKHDSDTPCYHVGFSPVYSSDPNNPNSSWSKYTPSGIIELNITNPAAFKQFEVDKEYLVEFNEV